METGRTELSARDILGQVVGVSHGPTDDYLFITSENDGVLLVDKKSQKCNRSWVFGGDGDGGMPLGPAVLQKKRGKCCIPMSARDGSERFLYIWKFSNVESKVLGHVASKVPLGVSVQSVVPVVRSKTGISTDEGVDFFADFFIISEDGSIMVCNDKGIVSECVHLRGDKVLAASNCEDGLHIIHQSQNVRQKKSKAVRYSKLKFLPNKKPGHLEVETSCAMKVPDGHSGDISAAHCFEECKAFLMLGDDTALLYNCSLDTQESMEPFIVRKLASSQSGEGRGKKRSSSRNISHGQEFVVRDCNGRLFVLRMKNNKALSLAAFDSTYGCPLWDKDSLTNDASQVVEMLVSEDSTVSIAIAFGGSRVSVFEAEVPKPSMANLVGSLRSVNSPDARKSQHKELSRTLDESEYDIKRRSTRLGPVKYSVQPKKNEDLLVTVAAQFSWEPLLHDAIEDTELELIEMVNNIQRAKDTGMMESSLEQQFLQHISKALKQVKKLKTSFSYETASGALVCLAGMKKWDEILGILRTSHPRSLDHCPGVAFVLSENAQYQILQIFLSGAVDIDIQELKLVIESLVQPSNNNLRVSQQNFRKSLREIADAYIKHAEKVPGKQARYEACIAAAAVDGFSSRQISCHALACLSADSVTIIAALRRTHSQSLTYLFKYFLQWTKNLTTFDVFSGGTIEKKGVCITCPTYSATIRWLSMIVDAANLRAAHIPGVDEMFSGAQLEIASQIQSIKGLAGVKGLLSDIRSGAPSRDATKANGLSIECLSL